MIVILKPDVNTDSTEYKSLLQHLSQLPKVESRVHEVQGEYQTLTEIYLIGQTSTIALESLQEMPGVERVIRISEEYRVLGRHSDDSRSMSFDYNGVVFSQDNLNIFAGLCAVDNKEHVETMMKALQANGLVCTRMGVYPSRATAPNVCLMSLNWQENTALK